MMCVTLRASRVTKMQYGRILASALFAGATTGLIAALLQLAFVQPTLLHSELYESGELVHFGGELVSAHPALPGFDAMRDGMSILFTVVIYIGYAMVMVALLAIAEQRGRKITPKKGLLWGMCGFITFQFAPGLGLAPEVPGVAAADIELRQIWWIGTVISTGLGLWLIAFGANKGAYIIGAILLLLPHVIGAPEPEVFIGPVPPELAALFAARAFGVGMAAWVLLGLTSAYFWSAEGNRRQDTT